MTTPAIEQETPEESPSASEQWAADSERLESEPQEGASGAPPADAELPPEPSPELVTARAEIDRLNRVEAERLQSADAAALENEERNLETESQVKATQFYQNLINQGEAEETARKDTEAERRVWMADRRTEIANKRANVAEGQMQAVDLSSQRSKIAAQFGVPEESLMIFTNPQQMEAYGKAAGSQDKRITALEQGQRNENAPVQQFANQANVGSASNGSYVDKLQKGEALPSTKEIDQITAKYLQ